MYASLFFSESTLEEEREKIKKYFRAIPPGRKFFRAAWELHRGLISRRKGFFEIFRKI